MENMDGGIIELNCLGEICPVPVLQIRKELPAIRAGATIVLITDHSCSLRGITEYCERVGLQCEEREVANGVWEFTVRK